ncbi:MAG TPA: glycerate dehydrogenase [Verrucomicrobiales bacterium]|nr:glycerate dehydrogenase [Verrucomicrobiales bacterium]
MGTPAAGSPRPRIVILDGHTLNPGDQSWSGLEALGDCQVHARSAPHEVVDRCRGAAVVITNKVPLSRATLEQLPDLRCIGVTATGYNIVDVAAARERGIPVTNVPTYGTRSVAQFTLALILELAHRVGMHADSVRAGDWSRCPDFCYWKSPLVELEGMTLGIVGFGRIGRAVADLGLALGMRVLASGRSGTPAVPDTTGVRRTDLATLFRESDVLSLHCPLTEETRHLVSRERLALMKPGAWLINTSRGPLVDEAALAEALNGGRLGAAAVDVLSVEPPDPGNPLLQARNCLVTPHQAWASLAARKRLMAVAVENVRAFLAGEPVNVVNR